MGKCVYKCVYKCVFTSLSVRLSVRVSVSVCIFTSGMNVEACNLCQYVDNIDDGKAVPYGRQA